MSSHYILDGHTPVPCDAMTWARWFDYAKDERIVAQTDVTPEIRVSTVFLGLDHSFGEGPPAIFETMIFGGPHDQDQWRYATWEQAEAGHLHAVGVAAPTPDVAERGR